MHFLLLYFCISYFCIYNNVSLACSAEFRDHLERSLSLRQPPPGSSFARDTARSRSLGRPGGASGLAHVLGIQDHLVEVLLWNLGGGPWDRWRVFLGHCWCRFFLGIRWWSLGLARALPESGSIFICSFSTSLWITLVTNKLFAPLYVS